MSKNSALRKLLTSLAAAFAMNAAVSAPVTLKIESWRYDDLPVWRDRIIPAFEAKHPNIKVVFTPTAPAEYDAALDSRLGAGTAGDLITCRPFDVSLRQYQKGRLLSLNELKGLANFTQIAKLAWTTDDGAATFCVPMASVIHGFIYNADAFHKLGIKVPVTTDEFFAALDKIKADGTYIPLVLGSKDRWETSTMGYQNIGPNYYRGEEGRKALIAGKAKLTDPEWVASFRILSKWNAYLGEGFEAQTYPDSQNLFTLGRGAIYPAGSWELSDFQKQATFKMGVFAPPVQKAGDKCYISDHPDIAMGVNAKSAHVEQAKTFVDWVASPEFAVLYSNALPGFFSLNKTKVELVDTLAKQIVGWRGKCESTIRPTAHMLSRGTPSLEDEFWIAASGVVNGTLAPEAAAQRLQAVLLRSYKPK